MANRTVRDAHTILGKNPQNLVEKVIRTRIYDSRYWKEDCFALTSELLVDKACELRYVGGVFGGTNTPTPFLCLLLKLLQIQPDKDIVIEFIKRNEFKYCRALGAIYLRLTGNAVEIYKYLETLYNDYSKLKVQEQDGSFSIIYMDDFIDHLLREDRVCSIVLPRLPKREVLEGRNELEPRISILDEDLQDLLLQAVEEEEEQEETKRRLGAATVTDRNDRNAGDKEDGGGRRRRSRSRDRERRISLSRSRSRGKSRSRSRDKARRRSPRRDRRHEKRDRSRERRHERDGSFERSRRRSDRKDYDSKYSKDRY